MRSVVLAGVLVALSAAAGAQEADTAQDVAAIRALAEAGDADAQAALAFLYDVGEGVPEDDAEAVRWYRAGARGGNTTAQFNLGLKYATGQGVAGDNLQAYLWLRLSTDGRTGDRLARAPSASSRR